MYSNPPSPAITTGAPHTVRLENKSNVEADEQLSPRSCSVVSVRICFDWSRNWRVPHVDDSPLMWSSRGWGGCGRSRGGRYSEVILTNRWMHKTQLSHQRTRWTTCKLRDVDDNVALRCINEHSLLLPICNMCCVAVACRWWWTMLARTINDVMTRVRHKQCHHLDRRRLRWRWLDH
jgi:hypothetical protein